VAGKNRGTANPRQVIETTASAGENAHGLRAEYLDTPTGPILLLTDGEGRLHEVRWGAYEPQLPDLSEPSAARSALVAYFEGAVDALRELPVVMAGTDFQRAVWSELRRIPVGETISYGTLAARIGRPTATRPVGLANGANPIPIVVPCHRVIGADHTLTGFGGGLQRKQWLLQHERLHRPTRGSEFQLRLGL
jgi:methylated-DNA-[protein]-cysteine S-methyltransferase